MAVVPSSSLSPATPLLRRVGSRDPEAWTLIAAASASVRVNGQTLPSGLKLLRHRDAVQVAAAQPLFYSAERIPVVRPFPGAPEPIFCVRSKTQLQLGDPAVQCKSCSCWFVQTDSIPAFTYGPSCPICGARTALDGELEWQPVL